MRSYNEGDSFVGAFEIDVEHDDARALAGVGLANSLRDARSAASDGRDVPCKKPSHFASTLSTVIYRVGTIPQRSGFPHLTQSAQQRPHGNPVAATSSPDNAQTLSEARKAVRNAISEACTKR
jgi:hypothetical protein